MYINTHVHAHIYNKFVTLCVYICIYDHICSFQRSEAAPQMQSPNEHWARNEKAKQPKWQQLVQFLNPGFGSHRSKPKRKGAIYLRASWLICLWL